MKDSWLMHLPFIVMSHCAATGRHMNVKTEDADQAAGEHERDDGPGELAKAAVRVQAEVEDQDGAFDEEHPDAVDVFLGEVVLV